MTAMSDAPLDGSDESIRVAVRIRPFLPFESGTKGCIDVLPDESSYDLPEEDPASSSSEGRSVRIGLGSSNKHSFTFDRAFSGKATQRRVYDSVVRPLVARLLEGYNATTLAYGQTGAGKTYTILGPSCSHSSSDDDGSAGVIPRALRDVFDRLELRKNNGGSETKSGNDGESGDGDGDEDEDEYDFDYSVRVQFLELYGEEIRDLLSPSSSSSPSSPRSRLAIRDKGNDAEVVGATSVPVKNAQDALLCLTKGMLRRVTGATAMNAESSRSHAIMTLLVEQRKRKRKRAGDNGGDEGGGKGGGEAEVIKSKFNFVDLAGSERQKRTGAKGKRLKEGIDINKGLLVLGNVISALGDPSKSGSKFVPFRDSKLTRLLRGSLGGNHKTLMIACASPSSRNAEESLNCLRYANRAKNIQNKAVKHVDGKSKMVAELKVKVKGLAAELLRIRNGGDANEGSPFTLQTLQALAGSKGGGAATASSSSSAPPNDAAKQPQDDAAAAAAVAAVAEGVGEEIDRLQASLRETRRDLSDHRERLDAAEAERDVYCRRVQELEEKAKKGGGASPELTGEEKKDIEGDAIGAIADAIDAAEVSHDDEDDGTDDDGVAGENGDATKNAAPQSSADDGRADSEELAEARKQVGALEAEAESLRESLREAEMDLAARSEDLETALSERDQYRDQLREVPDVDDATIAAIVEGIIAFDGRSQGQTLDNLGSMESTDFEEGTEVGSDEEEEDNVLAVPRGATLESTAVLYQTGLFLVDHDAFEQSIPCFEAVLLTRREMYGWDDSSVGDALHMEGYVHFRTGDHDKALMLLWDALRIRKMSEDVMKVAATLRLLADLHFSKEEHMHASLFYEECMRHLKTLGGHNERNLPEVLIDLARTKDKLQEYDMAMQYFEEARDTWERSIGTNDQRMASLQYEIGVLAFQMGDRRKGEECFQDFIRIRKLSGDELDEGVANALFVLGSLHWAKKQRDEAQQCWSDALHIFQGLGRSEDDPYVKSLREKLGRKSAPKRKGLLGRIRRNQNGSEQEAS